MKRYSDLVITAVVGALFLLVIIVGATIYWTSRQKPTEITSISKFDQIYTKEINQITKLCSMMALRDLHIGNGDIEVRVWRTGLYGTEGMFFKRINDQWSGSHVTAKYIEDAQLIAPDVEELYSPISGWPAFWDSLVAKGLLAFPITPENDCDTRGLDGTIYFVEINQNGTYRNYQYHEYFFSCRESKPMTEIGEIIASEFYTGNEVCKEDKWIACFKQRKMR